ncbi:Glucanosyltransferase-domain-containing protein [Mycena latifolia]|nr:Glucanosyltransferase-domain-containing protein [Mycena latifolia]
MKLGAPALVSTSLLGLVTSVGAIPKITRTGRYLYSDDGSRFYIKGITYQNPDSTANLADATACSRDLPNFRELGINTIRAYSVDSSQNHDACMTALSGAGIYLILDLALPSNGSIDTANPAWSTNLLDQYIKTIDVFNKYDNVLAYNLGNEVLDVSATNAAPFIKAAARDIKAYLASISSSVLVGYAAKDSGTPAGAFPVAVADYLSCDPSGSNSASTSIDIFGLNNYEWCGNAPKTTYDPLNAAFKDYNVVAYFSEFGATNCPGPRVWTETGTLFTSPMTDIWSGGLAFNYFPTVDAQGLQYGMVEVSADNTVTPNADFHNLVSQYNLVSPPNSPPKTSVAASSFGTCPPASAGFAAATALPPTPNESECNCLASKLSCVFNPPAGDFTVLVGNLTGFVCGTPHICDDIAANGISGVYGHVAMCDPSIKLSYAFSEYYQNASRAAAACDWNGNAKLNTAAAGAPSAAVSACLTGPTVALPTSPPGVTVASPLPPVASSPAGSSSGVTPGSSSPVGSTKNGAASLVGERKALVGMSAMAGFIVLGLFWTLA